MSESRQGKSSVVPTSKSELEYYWTQKNDLQRQLHEVLIYEEVVPAMK